MIISRSLDCQHIFFILFFIESHQHLSPAQLIVLGWHRVQIFSKTGTFVPDCFILFGYFHDYLPVKNQYINARLYHSYHISIFCLIFHWKAINTCRQLSWLFVADTASLRETDHPFFFSSFAKCILIVNTRYPFQVFNNGTIHFAFSPTNPHYKSVPPLSLILLQYLKMTLCTVCISEAYLLALCTITCQPKVHPSLQELKFLSVKWKYFSVQKIYWYCLPNYVRKVIDIPNTESYLPEE